MFVTIVNLNWKGFIELNKKKIISVCMVTGMEARYGKRKDPLLTAAAAADLFVHGCVK